MVKYFYELKIKSRTFWSGQEKTKIYGAEQKVRDKKYAKQNNQ